MIFLPFFHENRLQVSSWIELGRAIFIKEGSHTFLFDAMLICKKETHATIWFSKMRAISVPHRPYRDQ